MTAPKVSIVLPAFNSQATLAATLKSLEAQTLSDWETLIIDDGSTDDSVVIARAAAQRDPRFRVWERKHEGLVASLNFGVSQARAEFIARQDADDLSHPERLAKQLQMLERETHIGLVSCLVAHTTANDVWANPDNETRGYAGYCDWLNTVRSPEEIRRASFIESPLAHPTVVFRKELFELYGGYRDGPFPEDYDLWLRWLDCGVKMRKVPEKLYSWCDRPDRLSRIDARYGIDAFHRLKARALAFWLKGRSALEVIIWGAGPTSRKRAKFLEEHGCRIEAYIDVDERRRGQLIEQKRVYLLDEFSQLPQGKVILSYVGARGAGQQVRDFLRARGLEEERDFLICS